MSIQALALSIEEESPSQDLEVTGTTVNAAITVNLAGQTIDLQLDSTSGPGVTVAGTNVILEPTSSAQLPVIYNLTFKAGTGIGSFATPAAEIWVATAESVAVAVNPATGNKSFMMTFVNNLATTDNARAYSFDISYVPTGLEQKVRLKDPTILLDPPNS